MYKVIEMKSTSQVCCEVLHSYNKPHYPSSTCLTLSLVMAT